jgi:DNA sulfur modification protein DndE
MKLNKIVLSTEASDCLKQLKAKTGLTPNILSRMGLCFSLAEPGVPDPSLYPEEDREFNRYTLLGEWDNLYVALLLQRMVEEGIDADHTEDQFRAHLHRGVLALGKLAKSLPDIMRLSLRAANLTNASR